MGKKFKIIQSFGHKCSFCDSLNLTLDQISSLPKVLKLTNLNEDIEERIKIMQWFGHKYSFCHNLN